jgi:hypothetical protein
MMKKEMCINNSYLERKFEIIEAITQQNVHFEIFESIFFRTINSEQRSILWLHLNEHKQYALRQNLLFLRPENVLMHLITKVNPTLSRKHGNITKIPMFFIKAHNQIRLSTISEINENSEIIFNNLQSMHFAPNIAHLKVNHYYIFQFTVKINGSSFLLRKVSNPKSNFKTGRNTLPIM